MSKTLYVYVEPRFAKHVQTIGKQYFGSRSGFINALIAKDMAETPKLGIWRSKGEAYMNRVMRK